MGVGVYAPPPAPLAPAFLQLVDSLNLNVNFPIHNVGLTDKRGPARDLRKYKSTQGLHYLEVKSFYVIKILRIVSSKQYHHVVSDYIYVNNVCGNYSFLKV